MIRERVAEQRKQYYDKHEENVHAYWTGEIIYLGVLIRNKNNKEGEYTSTNTEKKRKHRRAQGGLFGRSCLLLHEGEERTAKCVPKCPPVSFFPPLF